MRSFATTTSHPSRVEELGAFVSGACYDDLSDAAREALKLRVLDSLGTALGALAAEPVARVRRLVEDFGGTPSCSLIGGGRSAPDRAALLNGALVRYLDFNDAYLAPGESCHPSDNLAPVLAACQYAGGDGRDVLAALAVAYQVQCRLSDAAPVRAAGFDHTTQGSYAVAAGVSIPTDDILRLVVADRRGGEDRPRARPREGDVRGGRPRGLRLVRQELRPGGQPLRRPLPDRPA